MASEDWAPDIDKLAYSIQAASKAVDIPESTLWMHIKNRKLKAVKVARRALITREAPLALLNDAAA